MLRAALFNPKAHSSVSKYVTTSFTTAIKSQLKLIGGFLFFARSLGTNAWDK